MIDVQDHHLGRAAGLAARLDNAGKGVEALHEADWTRGRAAADKQLFRRAQRRQVGAGARAVLEEHALGLGQAKDRLHGVFDPVDEARRALRIGLDADVEPHRRIERHLLRHQQVAKFGAVVVRGFLIREVAVLHAPVGDGVGDPADELAHRALPIGRAELATEVFLHHHVRRGLAPRFRHLHIALLEDDLAALAHDAGGPHVPLDPAESVVAWPGEKAFDLHPRGHLATSPALSTRITCRLAFFYFLARTLIHTLFTYLKLDPIWPIAALTPIVMFVKHLYSSSNNPKFSCRTG